MFPSDNAKFSGALNGYSQMDAALDPWGDAFASLLGGFGVTKQCLGMESTGRFSIKMRKKLMEASTDRLCAAEEAPMVSLSTACNPGDTLLASVC